MIYKQFFKNLSVFSVVILIGLSPSFSSSSCTSDEDRAIMAFNSDVRLSKYISPITGLALTGQKIYKNEDEPSVPVSAIGDDVVLTFCTLKDPAWYNPGHVYCVMETEKESTAEEDGEVIYRAAHFINKGKFPWIGAGRWVVDKTPQEILRKFFRGVSSKDLTEELPPMYDKVLSVRISDSKKKKEVLGYFGDSRDARYSSSGSCGGESCTTSLEPLLVASGFGSSRDLRRILPSSFKGMLISFREGPNPLVFTPPSTDEVKLHHTSIFSDIRYCNQFVSELGKGTANPQYKLESIEIFDGLYEEMGEIVGENRRLYFEVSVKSFLFILEKISERGKIRREFRERFNFATYLKYAEEMGLGDMRAGPARVTGGPEKKR